MPTADQLIDLIRPDFDALNELLISQLGSEIDLIEEVSQYLIQSGGKRVRPLVTLMGHARSAQRTTTIFRSLPRLSASIPQLCFMTTSLTVQMPAVANRAQTLLSGTAPVF